MNTIVCKFGGSSLASAEQFRKVKEIIQSDPARRYVVASAPGKRNAKDIKITDLLYRACTAAQEGRPYEEILGTIGGRYDGIASEPGIPFDTASEMEALRRHLAISPDPEFCASRGEHIGAKLLAAYLGFPFYDAKDGIVFRPDGTLSARRTDKALGEGLAGLSRAVIPGFYGAEEGGRIRTFSRGGSDVTGALAARAVHAGVYENWTDVSGMLFCDPRIVQDPQTIPYVTYRELRELSYMGASVLHEDAVFPVSAAGIPIHIMNTNRPGDDGTRIVPALPAGYRMRTVTGIAGKKGFSSILIEQSMMNSTVGFGAKLLAILASYGVPFEHCPTGIDTMSVVVETLHFTEHREEILSDIQKELMPERVLVEDGLAMIAVVGCGMVASRGCAARIFRTVADAGINIRMIDQGSSELNIILGVDEADFEDAIRSIYREFR